MNLTGEVRDRAREVALSLARATYRRHRLGRYTGAVRLAVEGLAILVAALGLTGRPWPDAVVVTCGVILADLAFLVVAVEIRALVRVGRAPAGRDRGDRERAAPLATTAIALAVSAVAAGAVVLGPALGWTGHAPYLDVDLTRLTWEFLPRWMPGRPWPIPARDPAATLLIGAAALLLHLTGVSLVAGWDRLRSTRRRRRDVVSGVLVPIVELLDLFATERTRDSAPVRRQAADLLLQVASNLTRAARRSSYPPRARREALAQQCRWHALNVIRSSGAPGVDRILDPVQETQVLARTVLSSLLPLPSLPPLPPLPGDHAIRS
jgi:hypothetical protein